MSRWFLSGRRNTVKLYLGNILHVRDMLTVVNSPFSYDGIVCIHFQRIRFCTCIDSVLPRFRSQHWWGICRFRLHIRSNLKLKIYFLHLLCFSVYRYQCTRLRWCNIRTNILVYNSGSILMHEITWQKHSKRKSSWL